MTLQELLQKRAQLISEARQMVDRAESENRAMTAEENDNYTKYLKDAAELNDRVNKRREIDDAHEDSEGTFSRDALLTDADTRRDSPPQEAEQRAAFVRYCRDGLTSMSATETRALQSDVDTSGGYVVLPQVLAGGLIQSVDNAVFMRSKATKFSIPNAQSLGAISLDADPADPTWVSELTVGSEDSTMAFGKRELNPHPLGQFIKVSRKLLRQASNVESLVMNRLAYKIAVVEEYAFLRGTGVNSPLGVFTASDDGITTARDVTTGNTATSIKIDGLKAAKYTLKSQYRNRANWMFHRDGIAQISQLKDGQGGYLWQPSVVLGEPDRLLNLPTAESEYVPNTFTASQYVGVLGDFSFYYIADAMNIEIQRLNELYAATNQVGFISRTATDGMPALAEAFVRVKLAA